MLPRPSYSALLPFFTHDRFAANRTIRSLCATEGTGKRLFASGVLTALVFLLSATSSLAGDDSVASTDDTNGDESSGLSQAKDRSAADLVDRPPLPPVGVRLAEVLEAGELRLGYSWERRRSQGFLAGTKDVTPDFVRGTLGYTSTPRSLEVTVHTFEIAYAPHPRVTLVAELPFVQAELERVDFSNSGPCSGVRCQYQSEGLGDVRFSMIVPFIRKGAESSQIHIGIDAPTGAFRRQGGTAIRLPYAAQPGNGTWDLEWGWTYKGELKRFSWGGQAVGRHPVARNGLEYREGSRFTGRLWGVVRVFSGLDVSLRAEWEKQNEIEGFDRSLRPTVDPLENPELYDRTSITLSPGMSIEIPALGGQRIGVEIGIPVYQDVDGPQLERDWTIKTAWRWVY